MELKFKNLHKRDNLPIEIHNNNIYFDPDSRSMTIDLDNGRFKLEESHFDILWSSGTPSDNITIPVALSDYKALNIIMSSNGKIISSIITSNGTHTMTVAVGEYSRLCSIKTDSITFGSVSQGKYMLCHPCEIYGIK